MISRFIKVCPGLFRGSAPTPEDVINLQKHFGIRKIISLDGGAGKKIDRITQALGIKHIIIPINDREYDPIILLVSQDLKELLLDGGPTFVHCLAGKDRTGMVISMFKCHYMGVSCEDAIAEMKSLGFGLHMDPKISRFYIQVIKQYCKCSDDQNNADIVDNSRPGGDWRGSVLDSADMKSFAPFVDSTRIYPYNNQYDYREDQYPTRNNQDLPDPSTQTIDSTDSPLVGMFDNQLGHGVGPVEPGTYFSGT